MTKTIPIFLLAAVIGAGPFMAGCSKSRDDSGGGTAAQEAKTLYTCGMHPQVIQDHPGNCPICGMKLTPVRKQSGVENPSPDTNAESRTIAIDSVTIQNMGIRTATVTRGPLRRIVRTVGVVDYNETTLGDVSTKFKGWIEKLYVNATGQLVMRGDPLFEIYSPDLYNAQVEYLLATASPGNATADADEIRSSALTKLKFFDISDGQIAELEKSRQPRKTLRILAPQDGFVTEKNVVEGQMVDAGMKIYRLADLGLVWVQADIYEQDLVYLKLGQEAAVTLSYLPDREFRGRVTYIYPNVDEKTRTARVRMEFHNPGYYLKPGMFATVKIVSELEPSALLIPDMAILRSGEKTTVFVALDGGKFDPRNVTLGPQAENDEYQVLGGVREGERVVTSGQFMLDSESQLREAIAKMTEPGKALGQAGREGMEPASTLAAGSAPPAGADGAVKYICPMPEHVSIEYDHPGKCSICGMTLVPVSQATLRKLQPGGKLLYYTCPMPEHSDVRSDKPGKCPRCGMTLIPIMEAAPIREPQP
jgi:RND family efflux transporter MFP subunit